jgi:hypothetical protein
LANHNQFGDPKGTSVDSRPAIERDLCYQFEAECATQIHVQTKYISRIQLQTGSIGLVQSPGGYPHLSLPYNRRTESGTLSIPFACYKEGTSVDSRPAIERDLCYQFEAECATQIIGLVQSPGGYPHLSLPYNRRTESGTLSIWALIRTDIRCRLLQGLSDIRPK